MIIQHPPDAKLPEHLFANASTGLYQNPFASSEDRLTSADGHSYPPHRASLADSDSPPAYAERQSQQPVPSASSSRLVSESETVVGPNKSKRVKRKRRLRIMAASVLCVYVTSSAILLALFFTGHLGKQSTSTRRPANNGFFQPELPPGYRPQGAPAGDGYAVMCNTWSSEKTSSARSHVQPECTDYLQYTLAPNISTTSLLKLFIRAGEYAASSGTLVVVSDASISVPIIDVTMKFRNPYVRSDTSVCLMRTPDKVGLGIYTSNSSAAEHPSFDLSLHLPAGLFVDELVTNLPFFTQNIGSSREDFETPLGTLQLGGSFSPMFVSGRNVTARNVIAQTSFSTIWGHFTTSESLTLQTSQAAINVNVSLVRLSDESKPVALSLTTENAIVQSAVTISTTTNNTCQDPSVSDFTIHAQSANAPVSVTVIHAPDSSAAKVDVVATSSYAPVVVSLDPLFEGTFSLTSGIGADFDEDDDIPDPLDRGRRRQYTITENTAWEVDGNVTWDPNDPFPRWGRANLSTQHAKAILYMKKKCTGSSCPSLNAMNLPNP
ncbi:hypothetical protein FRB90_005788 [Tulasnella sp. 427]|nr:hypothetical protein FRB90_005788 [Tulasnella sp. 427]